MDRKADEWIIKLDLKIHPEGGYYREIYRSEETIPGNKGSKKSAGSRNLCTSIYYLLMGHQFSAFHRIRSDEIWHFYTGTGMEIHQLDMDSGYSCSRLGINLSAGEEPQLLIKKNTWFAAHPVDKDHFSLVGCTVAPGFDFRDFELAEATVLTQHFPAYGSWIKKFCIR